MKRSLTRMIAGAVVLAGVSATTAEVEAMPVHPLAATVTAAPGVEHIWWRGYGWRRGFYGRGYGWRRPFVGYYGWRRPFYGYGWGWRRPFFRYGWRRW